MSVNNVEGNINQIGAGNHLFQNMQIDNSRNEEKGALTPKESNAVEVSISKEGIESYRKKFHESGMDGANGKVIVKEGKDSIIKRAKQATIRHE